MGFRRELKGLSRAPMGVVGMVVLATAMTVAPLAGCHRHEDAVSDAGAPVAAADAGPHVDTLAPNELVEGSEHAFSLPLPLAMKVVGGLPPASIVTRGRVQVDVLTAYLKKRVKGGSATVTDRSADFKDVVVPSKPDQPLVIHLDSNGFVTTMLITDDTPSKTPPVPSDQAYKQSGITPDNKLVDPLHMK